jgi:hypothetical protein
MATGFIGLAVAPRDRDVVYPTTINTAGLFEGAAVIYDTGNQVKAPTGAKALGFAGLIADVTPPTGTVVGTDLNVQRNKIGMGLLQAGATATRGVGLVIAATDGSLRSFVDGTDTNCEIVGTSEITITAGATNIAIPVNLDGFARIP